MCNNKESFLMLDKYLRKLAKKVEILNLFTASKEVNGIKLFINEIDFSHVQSKFLSYLYFYYNLYQDVYSKKVTDKVLDNEIYEDAYAYWKNKKEHKEEESTNKLRKLSGVFSKDNIIKFPNKEEN
jgi:hypothetical protein